METTDPTANSDTTANPSAGPDTATPTATGVLPPRRIVRPREGRMIGGVCASIADYFGVDVLLVRIAAVVLALSGGAGVVGYLALWLLTPSEDGPAAVTGLPDVVERLHGRRPWQVAGIVVLGLVAVSIVAHAAVVLVPALLVIGLVLALATRWWRVLLGLLLVAVLAGTTFLVAGPHLGSRDFTVARATDLADDYGSPVGAVRVDLRGLVLDRDRHTTVWAGSGDVVVTVPAGLAVHVEGQAGVGDVSVLGRTASGPGATITADSGPVTVGTPRLALDVVAGNGDVTVTSVG
jgi:phage shock protein PspC (stress-responsive transcriptional regulator)